MSAPPTPNTKVFFYNIKQTQISSKPAVSRAKVQTPPIWVQFYHSNQFHPFLCVLPELKILFKQIFIPTCLLLGLSWKWCQVVVHLPEHVVHPPAMYINVGPVTSISTFTGEIHLLHFQTTVMQLTLDSSDLTLSNMERVPQIEFSLSL